MQEEEAAVAAAAAAAGRRKNHNGDDGDDDDDETNKNGFVEVFDTRPATEFRLMTFSKFKKTDVKREILQSVLNGKVEAANYWAAEMVCAGQFSELWDHLLCCMSKHISIANPKLPLYMDMRRNSYLTILKTERSADFASAAAAAAATGGGDIHDDKEGGANTTELLEYRNSENIRRLFAEVISVLCFSGKRPAFEYMKIDREEEFDLESWTDRLKAPSPMYANGVFRKKSDPREAFIACNEFSYALHTRQVSAATYWIEWILEFEMHCKKKSEKLTCDRRSIPGVPYKFQDDILWLFWEIILDVVDGNDVIDNDNDNIQKDLYDSDDDNDDTAVLGGGGSKKHHINNELRSRIVHALWRLFCFNYTSVAGRRRKFLMYHAVFIATEEYWNANVEIVRRRDEIQNVVAQVNNFYKIIARNAVVDNSNFLMLSTKIT